MYIYTYYWETHTYSSCGVSLFLFCYRFEPYFERKKEAHAAAIRPLLLFILYFNFLLGDAFLTSNCFLIFLCVSIFSVLQIRDLFREKKEVHASAVRPLLLFILHVYVCIYIHVYIHILLGDTHTLHVPFSFLLQVRALFREKKEAHASALRPLLL